MICETCLYQRYCEDIGNTSGDDCVWYAPAIEEKEE